MSNVAKPAADWRPATTAEHTVIELLAGMRTAANYLGNGQLVTASTILNDILAKHGGGE